MIETGRPSRVEKDRRAEILARSAAIASLRSAVQGRFSATSADLAALDACRVFSDHEVDGSEKVTLQFGAELWERNPRLEAPVLKMILATPRGLLTAIIPIFDLKSAA